MVNDTGMSLPYCIHILRMVVLLLQRNYRLLGTEGDAAGIFYDSCFVVVVRAYETTVYSFLNSLAEAY